MPLEPSEVQVEQVIRNDQQSYWKKNNTGNTGKISASVKNYFLMVTSVFSSCS